jgi:uncharacterized protein (AIM24 family)
VKHEIKYSPAYSLLEVNLDPNEIIVAEAGAMVYMTPQINVKTRKREEKASGRALRQPFWAQNPSSSTSTLQRKAQARSASFQHQ